jgi:5-(carboxyamino)imidazole ribonucleotide synthase
MKPILPGTLGADGRPATLGVMGGGQLGRMFVQAAQAMGYFTAVLDPDPTSPAGLIAHYHIEADYLGEPGLAQLMQRCSAITTEFENVPATALYTLGAHRPVAPSAECVAVCQDRVERAFRRPACIARPSPVGAASAAVPQLLPGILKTSRLGYDGKGQVRRRAGSIAAWERSAALRARTVPLATRSASPSRASRGGACRCSRTCIATASWP